MKPLPLHPDLLAIAPRVIWFESPEKALSNPIRFMAYLMTYGTFEDVSVVQQYVSEKEMLEALKQAPPGIFDPRSWTYWNIKMGNDPVPPLPTRYFPDTDVP